MLRVAIFGLVAALLSCGGKKPAERSRDGHNLQGGITSAAEDPVRHAISAFDADPNVHSEVQALKDDGFDTVPGFPTEAILISKYCEPKEWNPRCRWEIVVSVKLTRQLQDFTRETRSIAAMVRPSDWESTTIELIQLATANEERPY